MRIPLLAAALVLAAPITSCDRAPAGPKENTGLARDEVSGKAPAAQPAGRGTGVLASDAETPAQNAFPSFAADPAAEWSSVVSKLPAPPAPPRAAPLPARRRQHDKATRRLLYALAASFAAATVALSLWVVDLRREVTGFSEPQINPIVRDLFIADAPRDVTGTGFNEIPAGDGLVTLIFPGGQECFQAHQVRTGRPEKYLVKGGDFRGNPRGQQARVHTKPEFWVEEFQENSARLNQLAERG